MDEVQKVLKDTEREFFDYPLNDDKLRLRTIMQIEKEIRNLEERKRRLEEGYIDYYGEMFNE
jgi:hypothetical protein